MLKKLRGTKEKGNERPIAHSHVQSHKQTAAPSRAQAGGQPPAPSLRAAVGAGSRTHLPAGAAPVLHAAPITAFRAAPSPAVLQTAARVAPGRSGTAFLSLSPPPPTSTAHPPPRSPEAVTVSPLSGDAPRRLGSGSQHRHQHQHQGAAPRGARGRPQPGGGTCNTHAALGRVGSVSRCFPPCPSPFCLAHLAACRAAGAALDGCSVAAEAPPAAVSAAVPAAPGEAAGTGRALPTPRLLAALQGGQRTHSAMKS